MKRLRLALATVLLCAAVLGGVRGAEPDEALPKVPRLSYPPPFKDVQVELPAQVTVLPEFRPRLPVFRVIPDKKAYIDDPEFYRPEYVGRSKKAAPTDVVTEANAGPMAEALVKGRGLWPEGAVQTRVLENWRGRTYLVVFRHRMPGLPYMVVGDRLEIDLDRASGRLHTLLLQWSRFEQVAEYPIMTPQEAVARINRGEGRVEILDVVEPVRGRVAKVELSYDANPDRTPCAQPVYKFTVAPKDEKGETKYVRIEAIRPEFLSEESEKADGVPGSGPTGSKSEQETIPSEGPASKPPG